MTGYVTIKDLTHKYIGKRILATVIDYVIVWTATILYMYEFGNHNYSYGSYSLNGWAVFAPFLIWSILLVIPEQYLDGTLGHHIAKIKVVSANSDKMTLKRTFKRRAMDFFDIFISFGLIAYLVAINTAYHQRLGDFVAKTYVIGRKDDPDQFQFDFEKVKP